MRGSKRDDEGYGECVPEDAPCGSPTHGCYNLASGERLGSESVEACQGGYEWRAARDAECRSADGDLMEAQDDASCESTNHTWVQGR